MLSTFQDHPDRKKRKPKFPIRLKLKGLILLTGCCSILLLMDLFLKQGLPSVEESEVGKHLSKLDTHKSVGSDGIQP